MSAPPLSRAAAALAAGKWEAARDAYREALESGETPEALEGLGWALFWLGEGEAGLALRERAFALYRRRGDLDRAVRVALALGVDSFDVRGQAVALGWIERARRLSEEAPPSLLHGWVALWDGHVARIVKRDAARAKALAEEAGLVASRHRSVELAMLARALEGLVKIDEGAVEEGMRRLDEATAAALAEMEDLDAAGTTCCFLIHACASVRDYERGAQWADRIRAFAERYGARSLVSSCEPTFAALLVGRGVHGEAEERLVRAERELKDARPFALPEVHEILGELRRRQGRRDEAASLFARAEGRSGATLGLAHLAFSRGDLAGADDLAERFLRASPPENWTGRAAAFALLVQARLAAGKAEAAAHAHEALAGVAARATLGYARAHLRASEGRLALAAGDAEAGRRALEDAVDDFGRCRCPFEEAEVRIDLARALDRLGRPEAARAEAETARSSFERLGAEEGVRRAGTALGPTPASALTRRERDVLRLASEGLSEKEIARRLGLSAHTVHRHVANVLRKLGVTSRTAAVAWALRTGAL